MSSIRFHPIMRSPALRSALSFLSSSEYKGVINGIFACLALICVQCLIGITFKAAQAGGHSYKFSPASSLTITEAIKFCLSLFLYYMGLEKRPTNLADSINKEKDYALLQEDESFETDADVSGLFVGHKPQRYRGWHVLYSWKDEVNRQTVIGFTALAVLYAVNNHSAFLVYRLADPGTVQLVKSSSTIITATVSMLFLARSIRELQWHALIFQMLGLVVTQVSDAHLAHSPSTYALLVSMTCISASAGVWNDHLCKSTNASLHVQNLVLYLVGTVLNFGAFYIRRTMFGDAEPPFFQGYNSISALGLIFLNASLGIIITAVYKYANAIYKGVATSITTAILLLISAAFFDAPLSLLSGLGCAVIFLASFSYIKAGMKPPSNPNAPKRQVKMLLGSSILFAMLTLVVITISIYGFEVPNSTPAAAAAPTPVATSAPAAAISVPVDLEPFVYEEAATLKTTETCKRTPLPPSKFKYTGPKKSTSFDDTLLVVFFNNPRYDVNLESFKTVYAPYFPNIVFVGPRSQDGDSRIDYSSEIEVDTFDDFSTAWPGSAAHHMIYKAILNHPCYEGYLAVGFDTWLNIPRLETFPKDRIWYPTPESEIIPAPNTTEIPWIAGWGPDPSTPRDTWGHWFDDAEVGLETCTKGAAALPAVYRNRLPTFPSGQPRILKHLADGHYIPGKLRESYLTVASTFFEHSRCFFEIAVPTILHVISNASEPAVRWYQNWYWPKPATMDDVFAEWNKGNEVDFVHAFDWKSRSPTDGSYTSQPQAGLEALIEDVWAQSTRRLQTVKPLLPNNFF